MATTKEKDIRDKANQARVNSEKIKAHAGPLIAEEIAQLLKAINTDANGNFENFIITEDIFKRIKNSLIATIESMERNPSMISLAAEFWVELPLWQKILGGAAVTIPTLVFAIIANLGFLFAICGVSAVVYTGGGLLLENHHQCGVKVTGSLTKGIMGLADLLELAITALDIIRQKLATEVNKLSTENKKLADNIKLLSTKISTLSVQVEASTRLSESLKDTKEKLENSVKELENQAVKQNDVIEEHKKQLAALNAQYQENQTKLGKEVNELKGIKSGLEKKITRMELISTQLSNQSAELLKILSEDQELQTQYLARMQKMLHDEKTSFGDLMQRWDAMREQFQEPLNALKRENESAHQLNQQMHQIVDKLKLVLITALQASPKVQQALAAKGFFANTEKSNIAIDELLNELPIEPIAPVTVAQI